MDIDKAALLEEGVDGVGGEGTDAEHCLEQIGAGTEMGDGAEVLDGVALFLERIIRCGRAFQRDGGRVDLKRLFGIRGQDDLALHHQRRAYVIFPDLVEIGERIVVHHLDGFKKRAVGEYDEAEGFGIADTAHPAANGDCVPVHGFHIPVKGADRCEVHMGMSFRRIGGFPQAPDLYPAAMRLKA